MTSEGKGYTREAALWPARKMLIFFIPALVLDLAMLAISVIAYTGAQSDGDRPALQKAYIRFTPPGNIIRPLVIALACLNVVVHPTIGTMLLFRLGHATKNGTMEQIKRLQRFMLCVLPYFIILALAWTICVAFQATYVPIIDDAVLPSCHVWGWELTQCPMVSTTWIGGMIYIAMYIVMCIFGAMTVYRLRFLDLEATQPYQAPASELELTEPPAYQIRPPSYLSSQGKALSLGTPKATRAERPEERGPLMKTLHETA
ncbi:uncharacterized protein F5Z01DRAFT_221271 [Emericellopsis atlantica]|uniref:Uncharacterized protein n=1 Tax=Emericellopsis atlantica TaxID=2614577 RepID=A0A9P7ZJ40_9HYPO|nr:uncharacterized protein F5Z01DRAFT_221271 [Emericellopsis atlantica]KAG9252632.1 hypothetical protein F5Z01DRAFT_221271 [Emericellopsis atlantica]